MKLYTAITTIQPPTECMHSLAKNLAKCGGHLVVTGDKKGPQAYDLPNTSFFSLEDQNSLNFKIETKLPTGHYARKNLSYLFAISQGAECIYETDDDNMPNEHWKVRTDEIKSPLVIPEADQWVNIYKYFSDAKIWPRGLPLNQICTTHPEAIQSTDTLISPIQQGLVNNAPDVDAIWRLVFDSEFNYSASSDGKSVYLKPGNWCPFNTQSTWWWPLAYPLLYIPSYCSFRMCDIWKSFIAQRCLWALGYGVTFHSPEAIQVRNEHNIMKDFTDEIPGYLENEKIKTILNLSDLKPGTENVGTNLRTCYSDLIAEGILLEKEMDLVELWLKDLTKITYAETSKKR